MGVHSLWSIVSPTSRAVRLESLSRKRMAVDASIWIYQFLKAMRSKDGQKLRSSHIVGFFRRICKLIYFGIQPVFVFDGGAPLLKRETIHRRKERRIGKRESTNKTAKRLLALQLQRQKDRTEDQPKVNKDEGEIIYNYMDDQNKTEEQLKQQEFAKFKSTDDYHLPQIKGFEHSKSDTRLISEEEYRDMADQLDELDGIDLNTIDPASAEFESLPLSTQYMVLSQLRLRSRLRMGYSREQLEDIFPDSKDFSKFQIQMVQKRNYFTQRLMNISGMDRNSPSLDDQIRRVAGEKDKQYRIQKTEGGWSLSLDDRGTSSNPIKVDKKDEEVRKPFQVENDESDVDWEDVSLESIEKKKVNQSISSLPLPPAATFGDIGDGTIRSFSFSPKKTKQQPRVDVDDDYFVEGVEKAELLEAIEKSRVELAKQQELEKKIVEEKLRDIHEEPHASDNDGFFEDIPFDIPTSKARETKNLSGPSKPMLNPTAPTIKVSDMRARTEMDHFLNLGTSLPKVPIIKDKAKNSDPLSESTRKKDLEAPSWANSSFKNPYKPINQQYEKQDEKIGLVPFHEVHELLKHRETENGDINEVDTSDAIIEIDSEPVSAEKKESQVQEIKDTTTEAEKLKSSREIGVAVYPNPSRSPLKQVENEKVQERLNVLDYEFYESEEEELANQLNQEEEEHAQFQKSLNPGIATSTLDTLGSLESLNKQRASDLRDSDEVTIEMIKEVQELLAYFGIPYITAPMEAEAQCAELLQLKLVDGIITDDSDVFLFGGDKVYKNMFHEKHYVEYYDGMTIKKELGLDRGKFIELALLLGSDYTEGVKSIGPVNAMEILAKFGDLGEFRNWFIKGQFDLGIQSKETSFQKKLRKKLVKSEVVLDKSFPDQRVKQAYFQPEVDSDRTGFKWGQPDLDRLRDFLMKTVGWTKDRVDEVLVPLIRDLNKKKREGVQTTLGEFYEVELSSFGGRKQKNKRMAEASTEIKKRRK